jgi:hypothetical protein
MSKFLNLCEEYDPENTENPKWELIDFLKSKGVHVSMVKNSNMIYIDTGSKTIAITVSEEEEAQSINQDLTDIANTGGINAPKAAQIINQKKRQEPKLIKKASDDLKETEKLLNRPKSQIIK